MSEITLTILDARRAIHGTTHGSDADRVVAALAAEPETVEELEGAVTRFSKPRGEREFFAFFRSGVSETPWDAGIVLIDLAARLVAAESTYSYPSREGRVRYHDGDRVTDVWVPYRVPDDWLFTDSLEGWPALSERRRAERAAARPLDARPVLYGKALTEFIVHECRSARAAGAEDPIADVHARWLMTPRADLREQTPREVLLAKREFIDLDLQWRADQWSFVEECPPGLDPESAAYRCGGFGTHENVLYYELIRHLLAACWQRASEEEVPAGEEIERLERLKEEWLYTPQDDLEGLTPFFVVACERARLPMALSPEQMDWDDDCPLCRMLREDPAPTFWHLDGCNMDNDFPFSFYHTREEWEEEQRSWEEWSREYEERRARERAGEEEVGVFPSVWQRSHTDWDGLASLPPGVALSVALVGLGGHLAELGLDLKDTPETEALAESLNRDFADLRGALREDEGWLVETSLQRLHEGLAAVAAARPGLADKCGDLQSQLERLGSLFEEQ